MESGTVVDMRAAAPLLRHSALVLAVCCADASQRAGSGFCASFRPLPASVDAHIPRVGETVYRVVCDYLDPTPAPRLSLNRWTADAEAKLLPVGLPPSRLLRPSLCSSSPQPGQPFSSSAHVALGETRRGSVSHLGRAVRCLLALSA